MDIEQQPQQPLVPSAGEPIERLGSMNRVVGFLSRHSAFFSKWSEVNLACACSTACVSCVGVAAGSVLVPLVAESRQVRAENSQPDQEL